MSDSTEKQSNSTKGKRGGVRAGSGRPKGSTNKVTTQQAVQGFFKLTGMDFAEFGHRWMIELKQDGQNDLATKLYGMLHKYHLDDEPQKLDVTSGGEAISINITPRETGQYGEN
jgi:hypothetical protein